MKVKSMFGEFVIIYDKEDNEVVEFQSDEIDKLEKSVCKLLDYLKITYEFEDE